MMNESNTTSKSSTSGSNNESNKGVLLSPISSYVVYGSGFEGVESQLTPIGHPIPGIGSHYNCHGWSLGYKLWINIAHTREGDELLQDSILQACAQVGVEGTDIFTSELSTYAHSTNPTLEQIGDVRDMGVGDIIAYYNDDGRLTHTARCRENSLGELVFSCKLGLGPVVEYSDAHLISTVYGNTIDYYSLE